MEAAKINKTIKQLEKLTPQNNHAIFLLRNYFSILAYENITNNSNKKDALKLAIFLNKIKVRREVIDILEYKLDHDEGTVLLFLNSLNKERSIKSEQTINKNIHLIFNKSSENKEILNEKKLRLVK